MHIAFYDPYVPAGVEIAVDAQRCKTVRDLMAMSDVVSLHTPSTAATRGLINGETLASAKHGMILINTARGPIVDLDALQAAMKSGQVAAAGLDVLPVEPADPSHPLIAAWMAREPWLDGRLTLSPHAAFYSPDGMVDLRTKCVETAIAYLETGSLINCVNRDLLDEGRRIARLPRQI